RLAERLVSPSLLLATVAPALPVFTPSLHDALPISACLRVGRGGRTWRLRARGPAGRQSRGALDRFGQRGGSARGGPRDAARRRDPIPRRLDAVVGDLRPADPGGAGQRPASHGEGSGRGGASLHLRMGTIRGKRGPRHRHDDLRGFRAPEGASEKVRLRAGSDRRGGEAVARPPVSAGSEKGDSSPLGATPSPDGVNFSVFSRHATGVELLLFDGVDDTKAASVVRLDPAANRTYYYWHVFVPNVRPGQLYGYRVDGPFDPSSGMRFDPAKVLLDPYGRGVDRKSTR